MNELITDYRVGFSVDDYEKAEKILYSFAPDHFSNEDYVSTFIENMIFDENYQAQCVKQPLYKKCTFNNVNFDGINGISSKIIECDFYNSKFKDAGMTYSDFSGTKFCDKTILDNCGCTKSNFSNVCFSELLANASVFDKSFFINSIFYNTKFLHCSFEDSLFDNVKIKNCDMINACLEFSTFKNIKFENVILPFWGVLKSFGLLQEIQNKDSIIIKYARYSKELTVSEFMNSLVKLEPYFYKKEEYFVLANINIFLKKQNDALYYLLLGVDKGLRESDFRSIRYLCKLASSNYLFSKENLRKLYNAIVNNMHLSGLNNHEYQLYLQETDEIKKLLIDNPFNMAQMNISFETDIDEKDYSSQGEFINLIESEIKILIPSASYYYNVRHNSPVVYDFLISADPNLLYNFANHISIILFGICTTTTVFRQTLSDLNLVLDPTDKIISIYNKLRDSKTEHEQKKLDVIKTQHEIDNLVLEKENLVLDKKKKELEIVELQNKLAKFNNGQTVKTVNFSIKTSNLEDIPIRNFVFESDKNDERK